MVDIIQNYWGIIVIIIAAVIYALYDFEKFKKKVVALIFVAEERAREYALKTGEEKFEWVARNGYPYLPKWLKFIISESTFKAIIQYIFDNIVKWAEEERNRESINI